MKKTHTAAVPHVVRVTTCRTAVVCVFQVLPTGADSSARVYIIGRPPSSTTPDPISGSSEIKEWVALRPYDLFMPFLPGTNYDKLGTYPASR